MLFDTYKPEYVESALTLCEEYAAHSSQYTTFKPERDRFIGLIDMCKDYGIVLVKDGQCVGLIAGTPTVSFLNNEKIIQVVLYYVQEAYRSHSKELYNIFEYFMTQQGFKTITLAVEVDGKEKLMNRYYKSLGYKEIERHYVKRI